MGGKGGRALQRAWGSAQEPAPAAAHEAHAPPHEKPALRRETPSLVKVFKNFKEMAAIKLPFAAEGIHGGPMLAVRGKDFVCFYDWATCHVRAAALPPAALCCCAARCRLKCRWLGGWARTDDQRSLLRHVLSRRLLNPPLPTHHHRSLTPACQHPSLLPMARSACAASTSPRAP